MTEMMSGVNTPDDAVAAVGLLKSAEIQPRWCQPWVSSRAPLRQNCWHGRGADRRAWLARQMATAQDGLYVCRLPYSAAVQDDRVQQEHCQVRLDVSSSKGSGPMPPS
jgi:hypothetical protein